MNVSCAGRTIALGAGLLLFAAAVRTNAAEPAAIWLKSGAHRIGFEKNGCVDVIQHAGWPANVIHKGVRSAQRPLWSIGLASDKGLGEAVTVDNVAQSPPKQWVMNRRKALELGMIWPGLSLGREKNVLDVRVQVLLYDDGRSEWRLELDNRSKTFGVSYVVFPKLAFKPIDPKAVDNFWAEPYRWGRVLRPFHKEPEGCASPTSHEFVYPNSMQMSFSALYGTSGRGLYVGLHDREGHMKRMNWEVDRERKSLLFWPRHYPADIDVPGKSYSMPYAVVLQPFQGDWYDACRIYRGWARKQIWCSRGPISKRRDLPDWLKQSDIVMRTYTERPGRTISQARRNSKALADLFGGNMVTIWYNWHRPERSKSAIADKYFHSSITMQSRKSPPTEGLRRALTEMRSRGISALGYVNCKIFDQTGNPDADPVARVIKPFVTRSPAGELQVYSSKCPVWDVCMATAGWQKHQADMAEYMMGLGFRGIYFDSYGRGQRFCYATDHGHSRGGGNFLVKGARKMGEMLRRRIKKADPEGILGSEASIDYFVDLVDLKLYHFNLVPHGQHLWPAVYHDYQLSHGRTLSAADFEKDEGRLWYMKTANLFHMGALFGRFFTSGKSMKAADHPEDVRTRFLKSLIQARRAGCDYFAFGEMMRPPRSLTNIPIVEAAGGKKGRYKVGLPVVQTSVWKAPGGNVALALTNIGARAMEVRLKMNTLEWGCRAGETLIMRELLPEANPGAPVTASGELIVEREMPPHAVVVLEFVRAKKP